MSYDENLACLQLCHQNFDGLQKDASLRMSNLLLVQKLFELGKEHIELAGLDHWPRDDEN